MERYPGLLATGGHPSVDMPAHVVEAAVRAARRPAYAPTHGLRELRVAIAERISAEIEHPVDPDRQVLITVGGMQALHLAASVYGARAVVHSPSFFFPQLVAAVGGSCQRTGGEAGPPDWEAFGRAIDALARAFAWQSLAIDGVAQAAALAALTGPQNWIEEAVAELGDARPRAVEAANASGVMRAEVPEAAAFVWAALDGDEDEWSERLAVDHGITALPGRHFGSRTPHLRIPFGGRPEAREALLERLRLLAAVEV